MRTLIALCVAVLWLGNGARAVQPPAPPPTYPLFEGVGGVSVSRPKFFQRETFVGWQINFGLNPRRNLRLVADFQGQQKGSGIEWEAHHATLRDYQFLWGPEYTWRRQRGTPFAHALFGVAARHVTTPSGDYYNPLNVLAVDFGFGSAFGGGLDVNLSRRWALRMPQVDYVLTHLKPNALQFSPVKDQLPAATNWQDNVRFTVGLVVRLGSRKAR